MSLNGVIAVTLRYFTEFGKPAFSTHNRVDLWRNLCTSTLYFVIVRVRRRRPFTFAISSPDEFRVFLFHKAGNKEKSKSSKHRNWA